MADEDTGAAGLPVDLVAAIAGLKAEDVSVLIVGGLGAGMKLNAGTDNGDGTVTLLDNDLRRPGGIRMRFPVGTSGPQMIAVTAISSDGHVKTGGLTVEPSLAAVDAGLGFRIADPVVMDQGGRLGFPVEVGVPGGLSKMVGEMTFRLTGVPLGVHLTGGRVQGGGAWGLGMADLANLNLVVPDGQGAFEVTLVAVARGQSGGKVTVTRTARVVPPGARMTEEAAKSQAQPQTQASRPGPALRTIRGGVDWLTGDGVFTFASGHGGDLFGGAYGWADTAAPALPAKGTGETLRLRVLAGGPRIEGAEPVVWS